MLGESENDRKVVDVFYTCDPTNHGTIRFKSDLARNRCVNMMQRKTPSVEKIQGNILFRYVVYMEERNLQKQGGFAKLLINQTRMIPLDRIFAHIERRTIRTYGRMVKPQWKQLRKKHSNTTNSLVFRHKSSN